MSKIGVMVCGHGSRDLEAITEFQSVAAGIEAAIAAISGRLGFPRIRPADHPRRTRQALWRWRAAHPGDPRHAVRRRPCEERHPLGAQHLCGPASRSQDRLRPRSRRGPKAARRRRPAHRAGRSRRHKPGRAGGDPADGRRPRHLRPRCQFQYQQGRADAVGGHGLRLGRGLLQRRYIPAGRARPRACGEAGLPAHHRLSLFPVHRRAGEAHLPHRRPARRAPSGDRVPESRLSQGSSRWCWTPSPTGSRRSWTARTR